MYYLFSINLKTFDNSKTIAHELKYIDGFNIMSTSLSNLVDNLCEKLHSDKCKDCNSELHYISVKDVSVLSVKRIIIKIVIKN